MPETPAAPAQTTFTIKVPSESATYTGFKLIVPNFHFLANIDTKLARSPKAVSRMVNVGTGEFVLCNRKCFFEVSGH